MQINPSFFNHDAQAGGFYPEAHVGIDISKFDQNQNILVEGIRGTGKTHILKMIETYCISNFSKRKVLPVFVSLAQISEHAKKDPSEFRLHLYTHIVQRTIETVVKHKSSIQPNDSLLQKTTIALKRLFGLGAPTTISDTLNQISETAEVLRFRLEYDLTSDSFKEKKSKTSSDTFSDSASLKVKTAGIKLASAASHGYSEMNTSQSEEAAMFVGSRLVHHNAERFIVEFMQQIQIVLDLEHVLLLLDECSEASKEAQVEIFRLFKTIRGTPSLISSRESCVFFVGSVYPKGQTYYPNRTNDGFSFEPGQDCTMEFLQCDETDLDTYISFFKEMTGSRARQFMNSNESFTNIESTLFDHPDAFLLAAYCAHGIPRRYWEILKRGYDPGSNKISYSGIEYAVQEIANHQILAIGYINEADIELISEIVDRLLDKNIDIRFKNNQPARENNPITQTIYVSIVREKASILSRLIMQGVIHDKSKMRTKSKKVIQPIFALDISIAYTFRLIPQKSFVSILSRDLPRSHVNGFEQALEIRDYGSLKYTRKYSDADEPLSQRHGNAIYKSKGKGAWSKKQPISRDLYTGIIEFDSYMFGFITSEELGTKIYFESRNIRHNFTLDTLNNSEVLFKIKNKGAGYEAFDIQQNRTDS